MNPTTLKALKLSIAHWSRIYRGKRRHGEGIGEDHCALCVDFLNRGCKGCPVKERTGYRGCLLTPYCDVQRLIFEGKSHENPEFRRAAKKEWQFLKSLLPKKPCPTTFKPSMKNAVVSPGGRSVAQERFVLEKELEAVRERLDACHEFYEPTEAQDVVRERELEHQEKQSSSRKAVP